MPASGQPEKTFQRYSTGCRPTSRAPQGCRSREAKNRERSEDRCCSTWIPPRQVGPIGTVAKITPADDVFGSDRQPWAQIIIRSTSSSVISSPVRSYSGGARVIVPRPACASSSAPPASTRIVERTAGAMTPSGTRGVLNEAASSYFLDATLAGSFVAR
jgi:hypothetical protein